MIEKPKRPKKIPNEDNKQPQTIQELIRRYDLDNTKIYDFLDDLVSQINLNKTQNDKQVNEIETRAIGTILYENEEGTAENITLNAPIEKFNYFEVESYVIYNEIKVYTTTGKLPIAGKERVHLNNSFVGTNVTGYQAYCKRIAILGTVVNVTNDRKYIAQTVTDGAATITDGIYTYITKITGYEN